MCLEMLRPVTQFSSVAQSCPTLCDPMDGSTPGLPVHHQLPELTQTHVHCIGDAIQPSHPLSSPSPFPESGSFPVSRFFASGGQDLVGHICHRPGLKGLQVAFACGSLLIWTEDAGQGGFGAPKTMAAHSSTLAWKIPWTEERGRLQSMGSRRVGHN